MAGRKDVRESIRSGSSCSPASEKSADEREPKRRKTVEREGELWYEEVQGDGSTLAGCREPDVCFELC